MPDEIALVLHIFYWFLFNYDQNKDALIMHPYFGFDDG